MLLSTGAAGASLDFPGVSPPNGSSVYRLISAGGENADRIKGVLEPPQQVVVLKCTAAEFHGAHVEAIGRIARSHELACETFVAAPGAIVLTWRSPVI
jgi:hypothetical protein